MAKQSISELFGGTTRGISPNKQSISNFLGYTPTQTQPQKDERDHNKGGFLGGVGYTLGKLGTGAFSVLEGIWDFTAGGIADFFGADEWAEEQFANNIAAGWNQDLDEWYNPSKGMQVVGDVASGISNTLVGIAGAAAITYFTGGAAAPYAGTIAAGIMGVGAAGNATSEAYAKTGELGFKEYAYGALSGGTEMALEKFTGVTGKYATKLLGKETAKTVAKKSLLKGMWSDFKSEFVEEAISEFITPYYQRWTQVDPNAENATIQQIGYAGLVGGLSGALMGGIGTGISSAKALNRGNEISKNQDYTNAVVGMAEKFAQYETDNNTGKEAYQYISQLVADFKARDNGTGTLTAMQKKLLGEMEHASVVLTYEPEIQRSKEKIIANADDFAQYINSRNIIDGATGKPFRFANGAELVQNDGLVTQFAVADALGQLMLAPDSVYDLVSSKRTDGIMQADFRNFQKGGRAEHKQAVNELFGIDVDGMTYEDFIETIKKTDKAKFDSIQGGMSARAASKKAISYAKNTGAEINAFDKGANIVEGTTVYTSKKGVGGKIIAITKTGNGYYLYNGEDISKKLTKAQLLEVIDALNGVAPATSQATETTAKKGQKTAKKPTAQTSPTGTQTAQETEKSKPKTAPKKKATVKKKTAAVKPATEKAKLTDKATQKREAIAKMRKSEDTTERVLAELYDNGAADYDAVSAMKDGQDLSTVDKVAYFATGTVKDYARQGLYTEKSLAKAIKEYADDIRAGKDVLVQVMDRAIELDGKQQPNWYKEQYHKAAESTQATETAKPKKVKASSLSKARENLLKFVLRKDNGREALRGAFMINSKQYLSDGYFAVAYDDAMEGLTQAKGEPMAILEKIIEAHRTTDAARSVNVDMDAIRENYPPRGADSMEYLAKLGDSYFQTQLVRKVGETLKNPVFYVANKMQKGVNAPFTEGMLYIKADNGEAVILPIMPDKKGSLPSEVVRYTADFVKTGATETISTQKRTTAPKKKTTTKKTAPKTKATETTTAKPVKEKTIHGKSYKDFTVEEFKALSAPFRNYYLAKSKKPNAIVFAQLGDFYEVFFDDAKTLANEFELTLTGRAVNGYTDRVEMVGFPVRFFDDYKAKLNAKGLDVVKVDLDGKKVLYAAKTDSASTTQYAISENATQETQLAGGKSQNLTPLQMKRAESFARTHVKGYENLTAAEKLEVEWTIASGWRYGASESDILSLAKISAQSGVGIGFADLKATTSDGKVVSPDAVCYTSGKHLTIYLNPKSKRTVEVATLHELTHALKGVKGYGELEKMALEYYAKHPEEKTAIDNAYRALYQNEQLRYEKEVLPDELTAHYIEKMLEKRNVLAQLTAEQPTFMQRCINWLKTRVDKLRGIDTQAADEVDILARKFVSTFNLNKGKITQQDKAQYALGKTYPDGVDLIDTYDEKQYNNFGWARVNGVLSYRENGNFRTKYGEIKSGKQSGVHRTSKGEIIVETNDMEGGKHGVNNVLVFAKGSYEDYRITKVIRLKINNETELEKVRDYIYGKETDEYRKSYYQTDDIIGLLYEEEYITRHTAQDFPAYKQIKQSREKSGRNDADSGIGAIGNGSLNSDSNNGKGKRLSGLDKSYLKLVEYGYMKTAQRMVDEEAKNAGYTIKAFHGSKSEFTFFDESKRGSNTKTETSKRWFFAADKKTANSYYPYGTMQKIYEQHPEWKWANPETLKNKGKLYSLYLKMDNPLIVDVADYDYAAHRETADAWMEFVEIADKNGNDGIILYNAMDNQLDTAARNSTVYMFRKSSQAKSADIVTYDNDGNVIPLSERFNSKKPDIRYALPVVDSDGKALSAAQQDYFKDSKILDEKGRLLTVYHGSPKAGFTEFTTELEGAYFTADKNYATEYAKGDKKGVYAVYLNITKPFDTREPAARKIFEKEFYGQWGNGAPLTARGLLDWTDGADMYDFIQEKGYDYDGIIIDEGGTPDGKGGVRDRGISYVAFHKNQIKNTTNVKPTKTNDIRYALSVDGETTPVDIEKGKNLVALHNLSEDKLLRVVELGGFPMPSIAVTTTELPHENYGDITVVFGRETVDPESDSRNVVYDRDAWTPTTPTVDVKLNEQGVDKLIQSLKGAVEKYSAYKSNIFGFFDGKYRDNNGDYIVSEYDYSKESFGERAIRNGGIVAAYLSEKGINIEPVYTERGFTMGWESFTREKAAELFDFVGITKDITRDNATQEQREVILEKFIKYRAKEKLGLMRRFKKDRTLTVEQVEEVLRSEYNDGNVSQLFFMAEDFFNEKRPKDIYDEYATLETLQSKITDKKDFYNWFWEKIEATFEKKGIDNGGDIFDRYGNRRSFEQRHYTYTAANIVKAMAKGDQEGKVPLGMTAGALAAKLSKRFDSVEDIHDAKQYLALVSEEDLKAFNDKTYELYDEVVTAIAGKSSDFMSDSHRRDDVGDILGKCAAVKPLTIENIKRKFASETRGYNLGYRFNDEIAEQTLLLFESLKHIPTTYFEAKPRRVVKLNEIKSVLLPESASEKLKAHLSRKNITWQVYGDGDNSRSKLIKSMDNARFALPLKGSDKVMTELPDEKVTIKDVLQGRATKAELATQVKGGMSETSEAVKVLMTNAQAALERVLTENGVADATARTNYIRAGKYAAHNAIETQGGQYSLDGETRVGDSLGKIMQPIYKANEKDGKTYADFELYLLHHHNIDRMAVGKPVFGDDVTAADSQTAIAELDKEYPQFRKIAEKIWKFNDNNLQLSVDSGMYSQEYADTLREMYPHYVPTFREEYATRAAALMGKNNVWVNNAKKAAKGSSARILPIDDMMAAQTIQKTTSARINSLLVEMLERGDHDEFKVIATEDAEIQIDDDTQVTTYEDKTKNTHQVTFYHNGKKVTAQVSRLVFKGIEAFRASSDMSDNVALNAVAKVNSTFKKLVTSLNPFFSFFKNPIRDMQDALLYTRYSHREYLKNYNRARQEIAHNGHYWQEAKAAGITAASVYDYQKGIEYKQNGAGAKVKRFWGKLESASNAIEMAPRMAEYISAREAGLSVQEALLQAQDVTTNFGRGGTFAKKLNSTVMPFLNPAIQGFSKMWRSYTGENGKKAWVNLIIRSLILGIGATALNDLLNGDDEEYENLSDYVKEQNYVIALGGGDFLKIPKGRVIGVFGNAFLRGKRYAQGETDAWEGYFDSVMSSVTPVENFTRTIFSPITDAQTNTTWYGGAIESQKWNDTEPKNRYDESTSKIAIWLGSVFNYSPLKIDYLLEQYTGIVGDLVLPATSTQAESGIITQNMLVNSTTNSKWSTKFYSTLEDYTYKKTAGDLQAKGAVRYLNSINSTVSDMYNQKRTIQADKTLSNDEKLTQTKIIQAAINTLMQEAIGNAEYIYGEMGKYNLADDDVFDQAYLDSISVVMGEEYALKSYNKDVYEKAVKINKLGIDYATYYDFYFGVKNITSDKKADGSTVAGSKKAKVINYVMAQNLSTAQKLVLIMAQGYSIADGDVKGLTAKQAKTTVAKYITSLNLTREEKTELAEMLGFTVKNGKIYFN